MEDKKFSEWFEDTRKKVKELRERDADNNAVRCMLIGMITAFAGEPEERTFTESQLKKIFDLSFTKK